MRFLILPLLVALPLVEIAGFVVVGRQIGALATVALVVVAMLAGMVLLKRQGLGVLRRARSEMDAGRDPSRELAHGVMILIASFLLIVPGFVTDICGLLLFVPQIRDMAWTWLKKRIAVVSFVDVSGFGGRRTSRGGATIDLDEADFSRRDTDRKRDGQSPWRRLPEE